MKKKALLTILSLLVLALLAWALSPTPLTVEVSSVTRGRFERAVQEDGKTRLRERYVVSTPISGRVARIEAKPGDTVKRGAIVATLWPVTPGLLDARTRAEQLAQVGVMRATLARARTGMERAEAALEQANVELGRAAALAEQGFISNHQLEATWLELRLRSKELESARLEEEAARHQLQQSQIALQPLSSLDSPGPVSAFAVRAPISATVLKVLQPSENILPAGSPLMELGDPGQLEVVVDILTEDAAQILPGTAVQLSNWGKDQLLNGRIRLIEPAAFTKVSALGVEEQRVNALVDITSPSQHWQSLGDGFKIDVRVLVQAEDNALKVPVSALFQMGTRSAVFALDKQRARLREVQVLARNGVEAWIQTDLAVGTPVIVYPDTRLVDGTRVKPR